MQFLIVAGVVMVTTAIGLAAAAGILDLSLRAMAAAVRSGRS